MEHRRPVSPIRNRVDWNTMGKPATPLATVPVPTPASLPPGQEPMLRVNHWTHVSQSPSQLWRPGLDRGERLAEPMVGHSGGLHMAAACGWQPTQIHEHMHARVHRVYKKPPPPPPPPPPPDEEDLPAWQILRKDDGTDNLDFTEAIGTLELALYVPVPLPWEHVPSEGRRRHGLVAGRHTAGFVTTVRELASRAAREGGDRASSVHSSLPSREREYAAATADLVRRTESIAVMTSAVTDDKPAPKSHSEVHGRPMTHQKSAVEVELEVLKERIAEIVSKKDNVVGLFRELDADGEGTLDLKEFRHGLRAIGLTDVPKEQSQMLFIELAGEAGVISYEQFVRQFEPDAHNRAMKQLQGVCRNNLGCVLILKEPRKAEGLLRASLKQQNEALRMKQHENLAIQLFQKVDTDGGGNIEAEEVAALSSRLGHPLTKTQLQEAMDEMDADGSGQVDLHEFQDWFSRGKEIDAAVTELNLSSVLLTLHRPAEALQTAQNAAKRLIACCRTSMVDSSTPTRRTRKAAKADRRRRRGPAGVNVGKLHATNPTFGSVAAIACLVHGRAEQKVAADYETFSMAARTFKHAADHAERWWDYSSPLAKRVIQVATRLEQRLLRHLPESTPQEKLRTLPIPVAAMQALERSRASTPGPSFADRRAAARRAYSRGGPGSKSMSRSASRAGGISVKVSQSYNYTGSSLQHASFCEDSDDECDEVRVDFMKPRPGSVLESLNNEFHPGDFYDLDSEGEPLMSETSSVLSDAAWSAISGAIAHDVPKKLSRAGLSREEQCVVAHEWSKRDGFASRGRARANEPNNISRNQPIPSFR